jgi:hypothetical protein
MLQDTLGSKMKTNGVGEPVQAGTSTHLGYSRFYNQSERAGVARRNGGADGPLGLRIRETEYGVTGARSPLHSQPAQ